MDIIPQEIFDPLSNGVKSMVKSIVVKAVWTGLTQKDNFQDAYNRTLKRVDDHYNHQIFGGNISLVFNKKEIKIELKQCLLAYGEPDWRRLEELLNIETFPDRFYDTFFSILFEELLKDPKTRGQLVDWLNSDYLNKIKQVTTDISQDTTVIIKEIAALNGLLKTVIEKLSETPVNFNVTPLQYDQVDNYIPRHLNQIAGFEFNKLKFDPIDNSGQVEEISLFNLVKKVPKIVILGIAGFGKSYELSNLAHQYSKEDSPFLPVFIRLNYITDQKIDQILDDEFKDWRNADPKNLLLIFDALDEVHSQSFSLFIKNLNRYSQKYFETRIVISCRNNLYSLKNNDGEGGTLEGFLEYSLKPLSHNQIVSYLDENENIDAYLFLKDIYRLGLYDLIQSPFYLVQLKELYQHKGGLPESKGSLFEYLINLRLQKDLDKFKYDGLDIESYYYHLKKTIEKLAFATECLGRNYLDERKELFYFVTEPELIIRIRRAFLFNRGAKNRWEFEHNNFQEYLAAVFLSEQAFSTIKSAIGFPPDYKIIKPKWVNTLSFLISLLKKDDVFNQLLQWIINTEPELLFRFEKDIIDLDVREKIVKEVVAKYEIRGLWLRSEKFGHADISKFVSESEEILNWLIQRIKSETDNKPLVHSLLLIRGLEKANEKKEIVKKVLMDLLFKDPSDEVIYESSKLFVHLKIEDDRLITILYEHVRYKNSQYIRASLYFYINNFNLSEMYFDLLIEGINLVKKKRVYVNDRHGKRDMHLYDESAYLIDAFGKIHNPRLVLKGLNWAINNPEKRIFHEQRIKEKIISVATRDFNDNPGYFPLLVLLFIKEDKDNSDDHLTFFIDFFTKTNTLFNAFIMIFDHFKNGNKDAFHSLAKVADQKATGFMLRKYKEGLITDDQLVWFRNNLSWHNKELSAHFQKALDLLNPELFSIKETENWQEKEYKMIKEDIRLIFNKTRFISKSKQIFKDIEKEILKEEDLSLYFLEKNYGIKPENNIVVETLNEFAKERGAINITEVEGLVKDNLNWEWFQISNLVDYHKRGQIQFNKKEVGFIEKWFGKNIKTANFRTAIKQDNDKDIIYRELERHLIYIFQNFQVSIDDEKALDFIYMDAPFILIMREKEENEGEDNKTLVFWIESKVGFNKTKNKVLSAISDENLAPVVKLNLFSYCADKNILKASKVILNEIHSSNYRSYDKKLLIDYYFKLNGDSQDIHNRLGGFDREVLLHALEKLAEIKFPELEKSFLFYLDKEKDKWDQINLIALMTKYAYLSGYERLCQWIIENKCFPHDDYHFVEPSKEFMDYLLSAYINVYEESLRSDFGSHDFRGRNFYLGLIIQTGALSEQNFLLVMEKLNQWKEEYKNLNFLYFKIEELENLYYAHTAQELKPEQIKQIINT